MNLIRSKKFENILIALMIMVQAMLLFILLAAREALNTYQIYSTSAYIIFVSFFLIYLFKKRKRTGKER